jgi:hypothetical protein
VNEKKKKGGVGFKKGDALSCPQVSVLAMSGFRIHNFSGDRGKKGGWCVLSTSTCDCEVYSIQHYVIKFVSDLRQVGGFLRALRFPSPINLLCIQSETLILEVVYTLIFPHTCIPSFVINVMKILSDSEEG